MGLPPQTLSALVLSLVPGSTRSHGNLAEQMSGRTPAVGEVEVKFRHERKNYCAVVVEFSSSEP